MKKFLSITLSVLMLACALCLTVFAENAPATADVYVTVSNKGSLVMTQEKITVTDKDSDGKITIDEVLFSAHEAKFEGGARAGYKSVMSDWGLSLTKLWGDESGNFGYYLNNASPLNLADTVKDGDYVDAFIYKNADFSDKYCFFDKNTVICKESDEITLTLSCAGYDESWNPVVLPVEGATITIDGAASEYKTDADGKVTIKLDKSGEVVISATSESMTLVPPVCKATVEAKAPDRATGENSANNPVGGDSDKTAVIVVCTLIAAAAIAGVVFFVVKKKKNEK